MVVLQSLSSPNPMSNSVVASARDNIVPLRIKHENTEDVDHDPVNICRERVIRKCHHLPELLHFIDDTSRFYYPRRRSHDDISRKSHPSQILGRCSGASRFWYWTWNIRAISCCWDILPDRDTSVEPAIMTSSQDLGLHCPWELHSDLYLTYYV